ncbi:MAG TPA: glucose-6-phosphate dehydrogenase assembly protein OpcA [Thermoanaerobaculia bacterium]|nr:glucose-6-phosphate dehydrogenase assembly protein OpcA [Thermoanaerobaculia bacterium]
MAKALNGEDVRVNAKTIEMRLADIWREEQHDDEDGEQAITRAALWNVVAHTWSSDQHARATEVLARASATVPQRTIVIRADPRGASDMSSWISANCHMIGGGRQVCSEEVNIVASGERVQHVPPLVHSLLLPDMPVAVWWLGDLPSGHREYAQSLLDPADRLIVDSSQFDSVDDLELVSRIAEESITAPADLNWGRLEEWRAATAALFDPPSMRERLRAIRNVRMTGPHRRAFGDSVAPLLYVSWLVAQTGAEVPFEIADDDALRSVEFQFQDGTSAQIRRDAERGAIIANAGGTEITIDCITRALAQDAEDLIVSLLQRPEADHVYVKTLRSALTLAPRLS